MNPTIVQGQSCPHCQGSVTRAGEPFAGVCASCGRAVTLPTVSGAAPPSPVTGSFPIPEDYQVIRKLGEGGMGVVFHAVHRTLDRPVALKFLSIEQPEAKARFVREGRILSLLRHTNVVAVYAFDEKAQYPLLVCEFVEGEPLTSIIVRERGLKPLRALRMFRAMLDGLGYCHELGVIHRDLKTDNILMAAGDLPKIADFGIASSQEVEGVKTRTGIIMGTPHYMSPEQTRSMKVDARSDLYSMGVILFQMLTATVPFNDPNPMNILVKHQREPPPDPRTFVPELSGALAQVVLKSLAKDPGERYQSAKEFHQALQDPALLRTDAVGSAPRKSRSMALSGQPGEPRATMAGPAATLSGRARTTRSMRSISVPVPGTPRRWPWAVAGLALLGALAITQFRSWSGTPGPGPPRSTVGSGSSSPALPLSPSTVALFSRRITPAGSRIYYQAWSDVEVRLQLSLTIQGRPSGVKVEEPVATRWHVGYIPAEESGGCRLTWSSLLPDGAHRILEEEVPQDPTDWARALSGWENAIKDWNDFRKAELVGGRSGGQSVVSLARRGVGADLRYTPFVKDLENSSPCLFQDAGRRILIQFLKSNSIEVGPDDSKQSVISQNLREVLPRVIAAVADLGPEGTDALERWAVVPRVQDVVERDPATGEPKLTPSKKKIRTAFGEIFDTRFHLLRGCLPALVRSGTQRASALVLDYLVRDWLRWSEPGAVELEVNHKLLRDRILLSSALARYDPGCGRRLVSQLANHPGHVERLMLVAARLAMEGNSTETTIRHLPVREDSELADATKIVDLGEMSLSVRELLIRGVHDLPGGWDKSWLKSRRPDDLRTPLLMALLLGIQSDRHGRISLERFLPPDDARTTLNSLVSESGESTSCSIRSMGDQGTLAELEPIFRYAAGSDPKTSRAAWAALARAAGQAWASRDRRVGWKSGLELKKLSFLADTARKRMEAGADTTGEALLFLSVIQPALAQPRLKEWLEDRDGRYHQWVATVARTLESGKVPDIPLPVPDMRTVLPSILAPLETGRSGIFLVDPLTYGVNTNLMAFPGDTLTVTFAGGVTHHSDQDDGQLIPVRTSLPCMTDLDSLRLKARIGRQVIPLSRWITGGRIQKQTSVARIKVQDTGPVMVSALLTRYMEYEDCWTSEFSEMLENSGLVLVRVELERSGTSPPGK